MYEYETRVRFSEVGEDRRMTLPAILNAFQDCSTFQSEDLGVGFGYLEEHRRMWVLYSWKIVVYRCPEVTERVRVATWPYEFGKVTGLRNFRLLDREGRLAACADSEWVYMDTERMRPARIDEETREIYQLDEKLEMEYETERIRLPESFAEEAPFAVRAHHLDSNHHVNNGQYVQMAAEYLPEGFVIHQMRAEYKKSAVLNDMIYPKLARQEDRCTVSLNGEGGKPYAVVEFQ